jgi:hypothetical protein
MKRNFAVCRDSAYDDALRHFEEGNYVDALKSMRMSSAAKAPEARKILRDCKYLIIEQCAYVIKECIAAHEYNKAHRMYEGLEELFGEVKKVKYMVDRVPDVPEPPTQSAEYPKSMKYLLVICSCLWIGYLLYAVFGVPLNPFYSGWDDDSDSWTVDSVEVNVEDTGETEVAQEEEMEDVQEEESEFNFKNMYFTFHGLIGGEYRITLHSYLPIDMTREENFYAEYWYGDGANGKLILRGRNEEGGHVDLMEYTEQGECSARWDVTRSEVDGVEVIEGTMTTANGNTYSVVCSQD